MRNAKFTEKVADAAGRTAGKVEATILAAEGKRSLKARAHTVAKVTRKAAKAGLVAGGLVAAAVVRREVMKRRKLAK